MPLVLQIPLISKVTEVSTFLPTYFIEAFETVAFLCHIFHSILGSSDLLSDF